MSGDARRIEGELAKPPPVDPVDPADPTDPDDPYPPYPEYPEGEGCGGISWEGQCDGDVVVCATLPVSTRFWVGPDVSAYGLAVAQEGHRQTIFELALPVGLKVMDALSVYVGPSYRVSMSEGGVDIPAGPLTRGAETSGDIHLAHGVGLVGGVRGF
ncbi:MAG: hypothetical protein WKG00_01290 [Polyangiaceae bacterium]